MVERKQLETRWICSFRTALEEETLGERLREVSNGKPWSITPGPTGSRRGIHRLLADGLGVEIWRQSGKRMFGDAPEPFDDLYGLEIFGVLSGAEEGNRPARESVYVELQGRILKILKATLELNKGVAEILAAFDGGDEVLSLSGMSLREVPAKIGMLCEVKALDLSNNLLMALPAEIGLLRSLEELVASDNSLFGLPPEIGQLSAIEILVLNGNQLSSLPAEIGHLRGLRYLQLEDNRLTALPPELGELTNLRRLWLQNNALKALPAELSRLEKLNDWIPDGKHLPPRFPLALNVSGNPDLNVPARLIAGGTQQILRYVGSQDKP